MPAKLIGAGWGRTGTASLQKALEILGYGPCHHMHEVLANKRQQVPFFQAALDGDRVDWEVLFAAYPSAVDWPVSAFWRELASHYPEAKVVLTVRDPQAWWQSFSRTILVQMRTPKEQFDDPEFVAMSNMVDQLIIERVFECAPDDKDAVLRRYSTYIDEVQESLPSDRLLTFEVGDGWAPLCDFLGCPIPDLPYPLLNTTVDYAREKMGS